MKTSFFCWGYPDTLGIFQCYCALPDQLYDTCTDAGQVYKCLS